MNPIKGTDTFFQLKTSFQQNPLEPASDIRGCALENERINCFTEFDPIEAVIVGYVDQTSRITNELWEETSEGQGFVGPYPQDMIKALQQDQEQVVEKLQQHGVKVVRVGRMDFSKQYQIKGQKSVGFCGFNARDLIFCYHDSLYEFPSDMVCRAHELEIYEGIEKKLNQNGSKIFKVEPSIAESCIRLQGKPKDWRSKETFSGEAANLIRAGWDILFQISMSGSYGCYKKFREEMEERYGKKVRVFPIFDVYTGIHVDTTFTILGFNQKIKKNIVLVNGRYVTKTNMPAIFRGENWRVLEFSEFESEGEDYKEYNLCSECIALNMLVISPELVMVSKHQSKIAEALEFYGIECIRTQHRYPKQIAGSFHCMTNEISRKDTYGFGRLIDSPQKSLTLEQRAGLFDPKLLEQLEKNGSDIEKWTEVCNELSVYPTYLEDHLAK